MKILLVEESKFQRVANGQALVRAGYSVIHAADGEEGLRAARESIPDLNSARHDVAQIVRTRCPSGS
jgi:DNA-binding response OmpR family regulator